jgi:uncharacterized protein YceH (UPF0502 family)
MSAEPALVLGLHERRVLGVLVEKAKTTPDAYPLSLNALVTGCNQKSNRDPVRTVSDVEAEDALASLQKRGLVNKITGGSRVERWRHLLYESWKVDKVELAILAELLLRGPQTEGELRGRASRMEPIDDLDKLRAVLKPLAERGLVVYLSPEGRRGTMLTHGFHAPQEVERLRASHQSADHEQVAPASPTVPSLSARLERAEAEIEALKAMVAELQEKLAALAIHVRAFPDSV